MLHLLVQLQWQQWEYHHMGCGVVWVYSATGLKKILVPLLLLFIFPLKVMTSWCMVTCASSWVLTMTKLVAVINKLLPGLIPIPTINGCFNDVTLKKQNHAVNLLMRQTTIFRWCNPDRRCRWLRGGTESLQYISEILKDGRRLRFSERHRGETSQWKNLLAK